MNRIQAPDGSILEFPDTMSENDMLAVMRREYGGPKTATDKAMEVGADVGKSVGSGLAKGAAGLAGTVGDTRSLGNSAMAWLGKRAGLSDETVGTLGKVADFASLATPFGWAPTTQQVKEAVQPFAGGALDYKPQTTAGRYAGAVAEFIPGAVAAPGGTVGNAIKFGVLPGVASEAASDLTKGNPYAKAGAAGATALAAAVLSRPNVANRMIAGNATNVTPQQWDAAQNLIRQAEQRGVHLTPAEAIQQVTGGATGLGTVQRIAESTTEGGQRLAPFMAERPAQMQAATETSLNTIAPRSAQPSYLGPQMQEASESVLGRLNSRINSLAEPYYDAARNTRLPAADFAQLQTLPGYAEAVKAIRGTPQLERYVSGLPDDSVGMLNEIKKYLSQQGSNYASDLQAGRNLQIAGGYGKDAGAARGIGVQASPEYEQALQIEQQLRQRVLDPLRAGPTGKLAATDDFVAQGNALMGDRPSPQEVGRAVANLNAANPQATSGLVREHLGRIGDRTVGGLDTAGRPDQFGGAKFAREVRAGREGQNIDAAVGGVSPLGQQELRQLGEILAATGQRQRPGSMTAFNQEALSDLKRGGIPSLVQGGVKPLARIQEAAGRIRLGRQSERLAELLMSGEEGLRQIREIARTGTGNQRAIAQMLLASPTVAQQQPSRTVNQP